MDVRLRLPILLLAIALGILTEIDAGDRPLDVYYGDLGFYVPSNAMKASNTQ